MVTSPKPGSNSQCDSYRGLTLTDHYGKAFMRLIIAAARPVLLRCAGGFQRASGACAGTILPLLILQGWLTQAVQSTCSFFVLFLDIKK
eukprot:2968865-Prorocentrum_lima.AAC.1